MGCNCGHCHEEHHEHHHEHGCGCGHSHGESLKKDVLRLVLAAVLLALAVLLPVKGWLRLALFAVPYFIVGGEVLLQAGKNIVKGHIFDEAFLMALATLGAFALGEYAEAVLVMLLFQLGELFEHLAEKRSRRSVAELMDLRPDHANVERDGELVSVSPAACAVGDIIAVRPGEKIPLDGTVLSGSSQLDTAALTGESVPRSVQEGEAVLSGCVNLTGLLRIRVEKAYENSTVAKILELVEHAAGGKAKSETFITRFARWYTPAVVIGAAILALTGSLVTGQWSVWVRRSLNFLVISCPCALVVSVPLSYFGGIGAASKKGILVKGSNYLEALADISVAVFDKTGTLTEGRFRVTQVRGEEKLLEYAALAESASNHPIAVSVREACGKEPDLSRVGRVEEIAGFGICAEVDGKTVLCGKAALLEQHGIKTEVPEEGTCVFVAADGAYLGCLVLEDAVKTDAAETVAGLKKLGAKKTVMLTGDREEPARAVAQKLAIDECCAGLLPQDKVTKVEALRQGKGKLLFVGDGLNDAPVLALADVGAAMGAFGSDAAMEAADVVLMEDKPSKLLTAVKIARKTRTIVRQNIALSIGVKALFLLLSAAGYVGLGWAIFADVGVLVLAVGNAVRALTPPKK